MTRRITVPDEHVALILPSQTADELFSLMRETRRHSSAGHQIVQQYKVECGDDEPSPRARDAAARYTIAGDIMLALLEAKEA